MVLVGRGRSFISSTAGARSGNGGGLVHDGRMRHRS